MSGTSKYNRWGNIKSVHNIYLRNNYMVMSNKQIADALGRTEDSVRKQLNKLGLSRPTKGSKNKRRVPKKRGRKKYRTLLMFILERQRKRRLNEYVVRKQAKDTGRKDRERKWASKILGEEKPNPRKKQPEERVPVRVDRRTTIYIRKGESKSKAIDRFKRNYGYGKD